LAESVVNFSRWLDANSGSDVIWYVKRLSGNDTLASGSHQAGPYVPKEFLFRIFPTIDRTDIKNPDTHFDLYIDSHSDHRRVRAIYYNNRYHDTTANRGRDEARLTNFGGVRSALLDPENTGALTVFAFRLDDRGHALDCHVWVCKSVSEEDLAEERVGPIEPGRYLVWSPGAAENVPQLIEKTRTSCWLDLAEMPAEWLRIFPSGSDIIRKTIEMRPDRKLSPDKRLQRRRDCEFQIFRSVEQAIELPKITAGFTSIDDFVIRAQTILQRRKARSGRSLELHTLEIFTEERLIEGQDFSHQPESDAGKRPDFLFPSEAAYKDTDFPEDQLRMLAVKTTCKDRWRQILNEANRIPIKHLLTLQEGVSLSQFKEMTEAGVRLVVPETLKESYPEEIRQRLQSLENFIDEIRLLADRAKRA
jgi:hypothetical protein